MSMSNEQQSLLKAIEEANNKQTEQLKQYINKEIQGIKEEIYKERDRITELEKKYMDLNEKYESLGKSLRKNNIIVFGLEYTNGNLLDFTLTKLNSLLQLTLTPSDINNLYTVGEKQTNKPIVIKFTTFLQKQNLLRNCYKLKGTRIRISEELSIEERREVDELQKYLKEAKSRNIKAYIRGTKLHMNDKYYSVKQLKYLQEIDRIQTSSEKEGNILIHSGNQEIGTQQKDKRKLGPIEELGNKADTVFDQEVGENSDTGGEGANASGLTDRPKKAAVSTRSQRKIHQTK